MIISQHYCFDYFSIFSLQTQKNVLQWDYQRDLATIGVCVFRCTFGWRIFLFWEVYMFKKTSSFILLISLITMGLLSCNNKSPTESQSKNPNTNHAISTEFLFYPLSDTTYGVSMSESQRYVQKLTIPASYNGFDVVEILPNGFSGATRLQTVIIEKGITTIGHDAFNSCDIIQIEIPQSVTTIGSSAFYGCENLISIMIPNSIKTIGHSAFNATNLTDVYYGGTAEDWNCISITAEYNYVLMKANIYFYSMTAPTITGNYWHYVDGVPTPW